MKRLGIHIFRRDLRLEDNTALNALVSKVDVVLPVFIFDERQINKHPYQSTPGLQILIESLEDLDRELRERGSKLHIRQGVAEQVVAELIKEYAPIALSYNKDYTPFAEKRDQVIDKVCKQNGVEVYALHDVTLHAPGTVVSKEGKPYSVYTRYRIAIEGLPTPAPIKLSSDATFLNTSHVISLVHFAKQILPEHKTLRVQGGRTYAKEMLRHLTSKHKYKAERDFPSINATSLLSTHIKFGTLSIREIYYFAKHKMPDPKTFLQEILWHDFFTTVAALTPHVYQGAYRKEFDAIKWETDKHSFELWKRGMTGFPIVDAGMRELRETGYMHNRVRMIVASFLIKDLHINWQWGEKYFATMLSDYDPAVNNGNWQWVAGTGCDASPWFRIFNPWLQQKKFDADCAYIKRWIPELKHLTPKDIHDEGGLARKEAGYPLPMCNHSEAARKTKILFGIIKK